MKLRDRPPFVPLSFRDFPGAHGSRAPEKYLHQSSVKTLPELIYDYTAFLEIGEGELPSTTPKEKRMRRRR
jgi:hypothetical protein